VRTSQSLERFYDDMLLVLHRPVATLPDAGRALLDRLYRGDGVLDGRTVLIVDDDIRNIFALTSVLESHHMTVLAAENGKDGIERLLATAGVDIVLMDIMMPEMDGFDTMRAIRKIPAFRELPIVAVTAKAMKGDRERCIEAGAWDYLAKPVDTEEMLGVFRTWLHR
jgi:CheY-like chemotaxis protein